MSRIVDIEPLLKELEEELQEFEDCTEVETFEESVEDAISELERLPVISTKTLQPQWINAKDKLPIEYQSVLGVAYGVQIRIVHYEPGEVWVEDTTDDEYEITHWMPLPEMPLLKLPKEN